MGRMKVYADVTEPGIIWYHLRSRCVDEGFETSRSWLHKRSGHGASVRGKTAHYGAGVDYLVADPMDIPLAVVERKDLHDLARSATLDRQQPSGPRIFQQLHDLRGHPLPILLLEGTPTVLYRRVEPLLLGLQFWACRQGISILYTSGPRATANAVFLITRKLRDELFAPQPTDR